MIDKNNWQGFCDIESDPAYFSAILREMGVQDVAVREVFTMDPDELHDSLAQPIYGLILLFHYREFGNADQPSECPADVWFANQLPAQNSCATLAMINILMNTPDVTMGEHLDQFKAFTRDLTPFQRGEALASFDFIKRIHNSFATKMDILESDKHLAYKVAKAQRLKAQPPPSRRPSSKTSSQPRRPRRRRRSSVDSTHTADSAASHEENAHHFIAFVPIGTQVWKLDGLDAQPTSVGTLDACPETHLQSSSASASASASSPTPSWLSLASSTITALMAATNNDHNNDNNYTIIALTPSPLATLRQQFCKTHNTLTHLTAHLRTHDPAFTPPSPPPPAPHTLGITPADLRRYPGDPGDAVEDAAARVEHVSRVLEAVGAQMVSEVQVQAEEEGRAAARRFDAGPAVQTWLGMLAENGYLERNLGRFMG